jgi:hypothetical protein
MRKLIPQKLIEDKIFIIRNQKVMTDKDLAEFYGVSTKRLNEQVKRNRKRFSETFMFQLKKEEFESLRSQNATSNRGGRRYLPYVFSEYGALMLANVLASQKAIDASVQIIETFVKLREFSYTHKELVQKISQLERKYDHHDYQIQKLFDKTRDTPMLQEKHIEIDGFKKKE